MVQLQQHLQTGLQLGQSVVGGSLCRALQPVVATLIAKIFVHRAVIFPLCHPQFDPVQIHIAADHRRRNGNGLLLQPQQGLQLFAGSGGVFGGDHADHLEHIRFKAHCAHLRHHGGAHGLVAGQGTELVHLVFQQKRVLAAALQQCGGCAVRQGCPLRLCTFHHQIFQFKRAGLCQFLGVTDGLALGLQLLRLLAQLELAALQREHTTQHCHGVFQAGKGTAQLVQVLAAVGGGVYFRQYHHAPGTEKGDGARCHDELLQLRGSAVQYSGVLVAVCRQHPHRRRHCLPHQIPLAGIKIVDRAALVGQLPEFCFRGHANAPFLL